VWRERAADGGRGTAVVGARGGALSSGRAREPSPPLLLFSSSPLLAFSTLVAWLSPMLLLLGTAWYLQANGTFGNWQTFATTHNGSIYGWPVTSDTIDLNGYVLTLPCSAGSWAANWGFEFSQIILVSGNFYVVTAVGGASTGGSAGTSGGSPPTWNTTPDATTLDGSGGTQITWTCLGTGTAGQGSAGGSSLPVLNVSTISAGTGSGDTAGGQIKIANGNSAILSFNGGGITSNYAGPILSWGTGTCTLTINGNCTYSGTYTTAAAFATATGNTLTINGSFTNSSSGYGLGGAAGTLALNGELISSGTGDAMYLTGTVAWSISNPGGVGLNVSNGIGIYNNSTGTGSVTAASATISGGSEIYRQAAASGTINISIGTTTHSGSTAVLLIGAGATINWTGDIVGTSTSTIFNNTGGATIVFNGSISRTIAAGNTGIDIYISAGTLTWIGSHSIPAGSQCVVQAAGGTLNLGASGAGNALSLAVAGVFELHQTSGSATIVQTYATITQELATAQVSGLGLASPLVVTGPSLPAIAAVLSPASGGPANYGYAGSLLVGVATGGGGTVPSAADVRYGVAVGSGTGTAYIPAAGDTRYGVNVDATTGTCYVPTAAQTLYGINVDATTGTMTMPNTDGHTPNAALVSTAAHFGAGNATQGTLDLTTYVLISNVVSPSYVVTGNNNYVGGSAGTYPTSATTAAAQLVTDTAAVTAQQAGFPAETTILGVSGTMPTFTQAQLNAMAAALTTNPIVVQTLVGQAGTLYLDLGDDYSSSRPLQFGVPAVFMDLTGSMPILDFILSSMIAQSPPPTPALSVSGTIQTGSFTINGVTYSTILQFTLTAAQTAQLQVGQNYTYRVRCVWTSPSQTVTVVQPSSCVLRW
jgi:hypothetical protein